MHSLGKLDELVSSKSHIIPHASLSFLEELAGLYRVDNRKFSEILNWYRSQTWGRLIRPWTVLVRAESETKRETIPYPDSLEPREVFLRVMNVMGGGGAFVEKLNQHVEDGKHNSEVFLNQVSDWMWDQFADDHFSEIKRHWRDFRQRIPQLIQSWGETRIEPNRDYNRLQHFQAHFSFWYAKQFLAIAGGRKLEGNDAYDLGYYVEATTLGNLVTNDKDLKRTADLIPGNTINVCDGEEWIRRVG